LDRLSIFSTSKKLETQFSLMNHDCVRKRTHLCPKWKSSSLVAALPVNGFLDWFSCLAHQIQLRRTSKSLDKVS